MNDAYTVQFRHGHTYETEIFHTTRRGLKSLLERTLSKGHDHHPDAIILAIDSKESWKNEKMWIRKGHVVVSYGVDVQFIQHRLATAGVVYIGTYYGDCDSACHALLKLVKVSEFRYDAFWKLPVGSQFRDWFSEYTEDGWARGDRNCDDGDFHHGVNCFFETEDAAIAWLGEQTPEP